MELQQALDRITHNIDRQRGLSMRLNQQIRCAVMNGTIKKREMAHFGYNWNKQQQSRLMHHAGNTIRVLRYAITRVEQGENEAGPVLSMIMEVEKDLFGMNQAMAFYLEEIKNREEQGPPSIFHQLFARCYYYVVGLAY